MTEPDQVIRHYGLEDLRERLATALRTAGLEDTTLLSPEDLAPLDQFHTRGLAATIELAKSVGIKRDAEVLDIGSGLGGPSRYLAATYGCHVRGVDLSGVRDCRDVPCRAGWVDRPRHLPTRRRNAIALWRGALRHCVDTACRNEHSGPRGLLCRSLPRVAQGRTSCNLRRCAGRGRPATVSRAMVSVSRNELPAYGRRHAAGTGSPGVSARHMGGQNWRKYSMVR